MEYRSKYKAEEIEAILDAKNNTGEGVDSNLDEMFTGQLQTKEVEVSADTTIKADEGFLGLKEVSVKVSGEGGGSASSMEYVAFDSEKDLLTYGEYLGAFAYLVKYPTKIETISLMMVMGETVNDAVAFAICPNAVIDFQGEKKTIKDWASDFGANLDLLPRITEAEFYVL